VHNTHNFKPVLKFLESPTAGRLIADEVGLSKAIEAGCILKKLQACQVKAGVPRGSRSVGCSIARKFSFDRAANSSLKPVQLIRWVGPPGGRPDAVNRPSVMLKDDLPNKISIARTQGAVVGSAVTLDAENEAIGIRPQ
jgi:hypothetical protein